MKKLVLFFIFLLLPGAVYGQDQTELYSRKSLSQIKAYHQSNPGAVESLNKPFGSRGDTALCVAARRNSAEVAAYLLDLKADPCFARVSDKMTPLMIAARESAHPEVVDVLAQAAAQKGCLDAVDRNGASALMHAAMKTASADIVRRLMENKADPGLENAANANALYMIKHNKNFSPLDSVVRELADYTRSYTPPAFSAAIEAPALPEKIIPPEPAHQKDPDEAKAAMASSTMVPPVPGSNRTAGEPSPNDPPESAGSEPVREPGPDSTPPPVGQLHKPQEDSKPGRIKIDIDGMDIKTGFNIKVDQNPPVEARQADELKRSAPQGPWPLLMILAGVAMAVGAVIKIKSVHSDPDKRKQLIWSVIFGFCGVAVMMLSPYWAYLFSVVSAPDWIANNFLHCISALALFTAWLYRDLKESKTPAEQGQLKKDADVKEQPDLHYPAMADKSNPKPGEKPHDPAGLH